MRSKRMGALSLEVQKYGDQKCGRSRFKHSKRVGALALKAQQYGSSRFKHAKVIKSVGALALNA